MAPFFAPCQDDRIGSVRTRESNPCHWLIHRRDSTIRQYRVIFVVFNGLYGPMMLFLGDFFILFFWICVSIKCLIEDFGTKQGIRAGRWHAPLLPRWGTCRSGKTDLIESKPWDCWRHNGSWQFEKALSFLHIPRKQISRNLLKEQNRTRSTCIICISGKFSILYGDLTLSYHKFPILEVTNTLAVVAWMPLCCRWVRASAIDSPEIWHEHGQIKALPLKVSALSFHLSSTGSKDNRNECCLPLLKLEWVFIHEHLQLPRHTAQAPECLTSAKWDLFPKQSECWTFYMEGFDFNFLRNCQLSRNESNLLNTKSIEKPPVLQPWFQGTAKPWSQSHRPLLILLVLNGQNLCWPTLCP